MALLLHAGPVPLPELRAAVQAHCGDELPVRIWPDVGDAAEIEFALVSRIPHGALQGLPRLRLVGSLHAGVDHLLREGGIPAAVPLTRPVPQAGDVLMNEYVLTQVLQLHRELPAYALDQREGRWRKRAPLPVRERRVGFLGFGAMAAPAARLLRQVGFDVAAWARRARAEDGIHVFEGAAGLQALLARSQILVNLLPLTPDTENLIDARLLAQLPRGASLLNVGRGEHVVDADLLAALDGGHLATAVLDVFRQEPLPPDSPFWQHPRVVVTPHACRRVDIDDVVAQFAQEVARVQAGLPPLRAVDRAAGY
ncbi:2-hydroxyacid dehydrogenase [Pseudacidovorax sp. NFM-22]|uniref:2-hydroxyacid dehydrogenase n=1 Tax=Pseudacidovorax sp. NFM-22 TaxID=2744469 RepID=UPI001F405A23|nr:glyoxylate/hydroxypyruvate reductase A [Pseudacidovorax sp. NFM-22]